jgi:predicted 3-demethylubiquinone-9 3-methyltransferase (glyoxalase superfamily)
MQKITTHLWFDTQAEEAGKFYTSIFKHSSIGNIARYGESGAAISGRAKGSVMTVDFTLDEQKFCALNGGSIFKFNEAICLVVNCEDQSEVDELWNKLSDGGKSGQCGWLKDRYGVSWQIVPYAIGEMMGSKDAVTTERVMHALFKMTKIDIAGLKRAYEKS